MKDTTALWAKYDARITGMYAATVGAALVSDLLLLNDQGNVIQTAIGAYRQGETEQSLESLASLKRVLVTAAADTGPLRGTFIHDLINVTNRIGFILATEGEIEAADREFAATMELDANARGARESWLHRYNAAQTAAALGDLDSAVLLLQEAINQLESLRKRGDLSSSNLDYFMLHSQQADSGTWGLAACTLRWEWIPRLLEFELHLVHARLGLMTWSDAAAWVVSQDDLPEATKLIMTDAVMEPTYRVKDQ